MVQRHAARYCLHAYTKMESVTAMLQKLKWETLEQRRLKARVVMGYRIVNDLIMIPKDQLIPNTTSTRGHHMKFHKIYAKRNYSVTRTPSSLPSSPCGTHYQHQQCQRLPLMCLRRSWLVKFLRHHIKSTHPAFNSNHLSLSVVFYFPSSLFLY